MQISFAHTIRKYNIANIKKDLLAGIIIAAVSIPISMGYAQIAGLPAVYGLYGSVFPIIIFALFSTSPQFIFGVDAAPAALVGTALLSLNIEAGTEAAAKLVPIITMLVAAWLFVFYTLHAGRLVSYISAPVMGGFITGICAEIILMQIPKLYGGSSGIGELPELLVHIYESRADWHFASMVIGIATLMILIVSKKLFPKFPMTVLMMVVGAVVMRCFPATMSGVATLNAVEPGLPSWQFPGMMEVPLADVATISLSIAVVIMAETLLAENSYAIKNDYRVDNNQEILAFTLGNLAASLTGCCPINGSVSRTAMNEQYHGRTQLTGLIAGVTMMVILLFCTGFIGYLPVPVLTAIVISALMGATEFDLAARLWKLNRVECLIFFGAFFGVLMLGTINGVMIGIILSFVDVVIRSAKPARCYLGIQPGHRHFCSVDESQLVHPVEGVVIYRFSSNLFFANVDILQEDVESSIVPGTKAFILDASGIGHIDITAADRIATIHKKLKDRNVRFYIVEHIAGLNEQFRALGLGYLIEEGAVRRTIHVALKDMGINRPYPLEGEVENVELSASRKRRDNRIQEFLWAFGSEAETMIEKQIEQNIEELRLTGDVVELLRGKWQYKEAMDEDEWIVHLEEHLNDIVEASGVEAQTLIAMFESNREEAHARMVMEHPEIEEMYQKHRADLEKELREEYPDVYARIREFIERGKE